MNITINPDLTSHIVNDDITLECFLGSHNPETLVPFSSEEEVRAFIATSVMSNANYFMPYKTPEERAEEKRKAKEEEVRSIRNNLLSATDWRFRSDLTPSQEWKDYCQALRDITSQEGFPLNVTWPVSP